MTKSELIARLAARNPHLYQRDVERIVARSLTNLQGLAAAIASNCAVRAFSVKKRDPRTGAIRAPASRSRRLQARALFKTGKDLRDRLNKEAARAAGLFPAEPAAGDET
jgi:integration host factor subunit beta